MTIEHDRHTAAAEVLELGQVLFDDLIAFAETHQGPEDEDDPFPVEDVRAAAVEVFRALRVVLDIDTDPKGWEWR